MSFRFNFSQVSDSETSEVLNCNCSSDNLTSKNEEEEYLGTCDYLSVENKIWQNSREDVSLYQFGDLVIQYVTLSSLKMMTDNETFSQIDALKTDIIQGKYEGGLKLWECCIDLTFYLHENKCIKSGDEVLELGCGVGIPGIAAYMAGASVTFQDFNSEVLEFVTVPNVLLNTPKDRFPGFPEVCQFLYGDWGSIKKKYYSDVDSAQKYDIILTSETIYEKSNHKKLYELMKSALKPDGTIFLAAKMHYFGVGGGITDFEMLVKANDAFEITSVFRTTEGVERQILKMKFKER